MTAASGAERERHWENRSSGKIGRAAEAAESFSFAAGKLKSLENQNETTRKPSRREHGQCACAAAGKLEKSVGEIEEEKLVEKQ